MLLLPLVKIRLILLSGAATRLLGWWHAGRPRRPLLILAGLLAAVGGGMLLYNQFLYSNPLKIHTWQEVDPHQYGVASYLKGFFGLFYDAALRPLRLRPGLAAAAAGAASLLLARRSRPAPPLGGL